MITAGEKESTRAEGGLLPNSGFAYRVIRLTFGVFSVVFSGNLSRWHRFPGEGSPTMISSVFCSSGRMRFYRVSYFNGDTRQTERTIRRTEQNRYSIKIHVAPMWKLLYPLVRNRFFSSSRKIEWEGRVEHQRRMCRECYRGSRATVPTSLKPCPRWSK